MSLEVYVTVTNVFATHLFDQTTVLHGFIYKVGTEKAFCLGIKKFRNLKTCHKFEILKANMYTYS